MKNKFLLYGGLAIAGYFLYKHFTKKSVVASTEGTSEFVRSRSRIAGTPCMGGTVEQCKDACADNGMSWSGDVGSAGGSGGCVPTSSK